MSQPAKPSGMRFYLIVVDADVERLRPFARAINQSRLEKWHQLSSVWIIGGEGVTAQSLWNEYGKVLGGTNNALFIELTPNADRQGWLPTEAWVWLKTQLDKAAAPVVKVVDKRAVPTSVEDAVVLTAPPPVPAQPEPAADGEMLVVTALCDFCGYQGTWTSNACPRCGITRS
jgi:hypothetical protein